jgi:hypothetical protein
MSQAKRDEERLERLTEYNVFLAPYPFETFFIRFTHEKPSGRTGNG